MPRLEASVGTGKLTRPHANTSDVSTKLAAKLMSLPSSLLCRGEVEQGSIRGFDMASFNDILHQHDANTLEGLLASLDKRSKGQLSLSCKQFNHLMRQSVNTLVFHGNEDPTRSDPQLAGSPNALVERFPNCREVIIGLRCFQDATEHAPAIIEAAARYQSPIKRLQIDARTPADLITAAGTLRLASLLLPSLEFLWVRDFQYTPYTCNTIASLTGLTSLGLSTSTTKDSNGITAGNLSALSSLTSLQVLTVTHTFGSAGRLPSLGFAGHLTNLTYLRFQPPADLGPLAGCTQLQKLHLQTPYIPSRLLDEAGALEQPDLPTLNYQPLQQLSQLTELTLPLWADMSPLSALANLASLSICGQHPTQAGSFTLSLSPAIKHLIQLTCLDLSSLYGPAQSPMGFYALRRLKQLQVLSIDELHAGHLAALAGSTALTELRGNWSEGGFPDIPENLLQLQPFPCLQKFWGFIAVTETCFPPFHLFPSLLSIDKHEDEHDIFGTAVTAIAQHCQELSSLQIGRIRPPAVEAGYHGLQQHHALRSLAITVRTMSQLQTVATFTQLTSLDLTLEGHPTEDDWDPPFPGEASDLLVLLQLRPRLRELALTDPPPMTTAAAHAFVFGWQHQMVFILSFDVDRKQPLTVKRLEAAVDAWKKAQPGAPAHKVVVSL